MKLKEINKEELELLSYDDIAVLVLEDQNEKMKINDLFKKVCDLLELSDKVFEEKIVDFFEVLTTDKRFIQLDNGFWDLKVKYAQTIIIDDDDIESDIEIDDEDMDASEDKEEDFYDDEDADDSDDDLKDLVIISDDEDNEE